MSVPPSTIATVNLQPAGDSGSSDRQTISRAPTSLDSAGTQTVQSNPYEAGSQPSTMMGNENWNVGYSLIYPRQKAETKVRRTLYKQTLLGILNYVTESGYFVIDEQLGCFGGAGVKGQLDRWDIKYEIPFRELLVEFQKSITALQVEGAGHEFILSNNLSITRTGHPSYFTSDKQEMNHRLWQAYCAYRRLSAKLAELQHDEYQTRTPALYKQRVCVEKIAIAAAEWLLDAAEKINSDVLRGEAGLPTFVGWCAPWCLEDMPYADEVSSGQDHLEIPDVEAENKVW